MRPVVQLKNANAGEDTGIGTTNQIIDKMEQNKQLRYDIGKRIAQLRKEKGMSQTQLAEAIGMKQPNLAHIEAGRFSTTIDVLERIAEALDVKLDLI